MTDWTPAEIDTLRSVKGFRLRSENMTRLEVFSDAAFAFAMTMLIVSIGSIPQNYAELSLALKGTPAFFLSFTLIALFWSEHRSWSQRYGLENTAATLLTLALIFIVLVFVYPLRLIVSSFCSYFTQGWLPSEFEVNSHAELAGLFVVYGVGYALISMVFVLMYVNALRCSGNLLLSNVETIKTRQNLAIWITQLIFGIISAAFALLAPPNIGVYAGFIYVGLGFCIWIVGARFDGQLARL